MSEQAAQQPAGGPPPQPRPQQQGAPVSPPAPGQGLGPAPGQGMGQAPGQGLGPAPKAPSTGSGIVKRIIGAVVAFAVIGLGGVAWKYLSGDPEVAKVGDCLIDGPAEDMKIVKCTDATAEHKVVGKLDDKTEDELNSDADICADYPTAESALWGGKKGGKGYILCLEPVTK